jgi:MFS superfamily sulfate permease-like transporter
VRGTEFGWALIALAGVILLGTLQGILVAIVVSLVALAYQVSDPPVYVLGRKPGTNAFRPRTDQHPDDERLPGLLLLRPQGRLFFANAHRVGQKVLAFIAQSRPQVVVFDFSAVYDLEYTALKMLTEAEKRYREQGVLLWFAALNPGVLTMVRRSPLGSTLGARVVSPQRRLPVMPRRTDRRATLSGGRDRRARVRKRALAKRTRRSMPPRARTPAESVERSAEVLFGLIAAVTILGSLSIAKAGSNEVRTAMAAARLQPRVGLVERSCTSSGR